MSKRTLLTAAALVCLGACAFLVQSHALIEPDQIVPIEAFRSPQLRYDGGPEDAYRHVETRSSSIKSLHVAMRFYPRFLARYEDLFQTASANRGARIEISRSGVIALIIGSDAGKKFAPYVLSTNLRPNRWHRVRLDVSSDDRIVVQLDGKVIVDEINADLAYEISDFRLGTALDGLRPFYGRIQEASVSYRLFRRVVPLPLGVLEYAFGAMAFLAFSALLLAPLPEQP